MKKQVEIPGIGTVQNTGYDSFGVGQDGKPLYAHPAIKNLKDPLIGSTTVDTFRQMIKPFGILSKADNDNLDSIVVDSQNMDKPVPGTEGDWDRLESGHKAITKATHGLQNFTLSNGQKVTDYDLVKPGKDGTPGLKLMSALGMMTEGADSVAVRNNWRKLDVLGRLKYGNTGIDGILDAADSVGFLTGAPSPQEGAKKLATPTNDIDVNTVTGTVGASKGIKNVVSSWGVNTDQKKGQKALNSLEMYNGAERLRQADPKVYGGLLSYSTDKHSLGDHRESTGEINYLADMGSIALSRLLKGNNTKAVDKEGLKISNEIVGKANQEKLTDKNYDTLVTKLRAKFAQSGIRSNEDLDDLINVATRDGRLDFEDILMAKHVGGMLYGDNGYAVAQSTVNTKNDGHKIAKDKKYY